MRRYFLVNSSLFLLICLLFPSLGVCQDIPQPENFPSPNVNLELQFNDASQELELKLADAVYLALQNNRELKIAYLQRLISKRELAETESQFNPTFTPELAINFNNNHNGDNVSNNTNASLGANFKLKVPTGGDLSLTWQGQNNLSRNRGINNSAEINSLGQNISLNFSQPLLRGFGTELNSLGIQRARLTEKTNILQLKNTLGETITKTIYSYRNLLLAQERLKIEQLSFANSQKELERLEALFAFGRIPRNDLIERQADIAQQQVNLLNTQGNLEQAIADLIQVIDLPVSRKLIAIETPTPPTSLNLIDFPRMLELALNNNLAYLTAVNSVENAKFGIREAQNQQQLDLRLNVGYNFNSSSNNPDSGNFTSAVILSREFGNMSQDNAVEKSQINLQSANYSLEKTRRDLEERLKAIVRNVNDSFVQIQLAQQARELAANNVENAKERMRLGSNVSMTDIINFENRLVDAKNQELNTITTHLNSMTDLEQFLGLTVNKWLSE
jgi:outer membrane protein